MARDDFTQSVKNKLRDRVAHRCSNPECRVPTSAPAGEDKVNNIGVAAHISAASPGGARYDKSMSSKERTSIKNGIWLCYICSIKIDRDEKRYPVSLLEQWKKDAEDTAISEHGKKLPSNGETIETVTQALTGFPKNYIATAISNVHQANNKSLEFIDPRFLIKSAYDGKNTSFEVHAKEEVPLLMKIKNVGTAGEYMEKLRSLIEHGTDIEIKTKDISIEGSKLFDKILNTVDGVLRFFPENKLKATQKLWLVEKETRQIEQFDDIHGVISSGTKSFTFSGSACNELFNLSYQKSLDRTNDNANFSISLNWDKWEGLNLNLLPYFDKILSFFSKVVEGWEIFTSLEINGTKILSSEGTNASQWDYAIEINGFLHYTNRCKTISDAMCLNDVAYTSNITYTAEEHKYISEVAEIIKEQKIYSENDITRNATCELIVDEECKNVRMLEQTLEPSSVCFVEREQEIINIFGTTINLPHRIMSLDSVLPRIHGEIENLQSGDVVKVEWLPQKDFKLTVRYDI